MLKPLYDSRDYLRRAWGKHAWLLPNVCLMYAFKEQLGALT